MLTALSKYEEWSTLSDSRKREIIDTVSSEQLAQYVLDDEHFAEFYDKVKENEQIRQEVARRQADLEKQIQKPKKKLLKQSSERVTPRQPPMRRKLAATKSKHES